MASMSSYSQSWNHDVFLCFRGEDTRGNFVGHLYEALLQQGIVTFKDQDLLLIGEPIYPSIFKAIQESRIAIIVFSKNFALSTFCLNELAYILDSSYKRGQAVMPIFYGVAPNEVRKQQGSYGEFLEMHKHNNHDNDKVKSWSEALTIAASISGWDINYGNESEDIKRVVDRISVMLYPNKNLIGTRSHLQDLEHTNGAGDAFDNHSKQATKSMASSSLSSHPLSGSWKYHVFVSFRDETRNIFVSHLHSALNQQGIITYKDVETQQLGHSLHLKAIEESQIAVVVFSENYASSKMCLDELVYVMKCSQERGNIVMPIFYHVYPSDVRRQTGRFREAFDEHQQKGRNNVESWRCALQDACNLFGWIIVGDESKCIRKIVDTISKRLFPNKGLIGTWTNLEDFTYGGHGVATLAYSHEDVEHLKIPHEDILMATKNFAENNIIGRGGFGMVYRGESKELGIVAIKKLDRKYGQGDNEFLMEIALLSACKHENLVSLVGFCTQHNEKILVYKYESNGSLDKHLPSKDLTWIKRLQICLDAANGLKYLHDDVGPRQRFIHRDIKSSNVLLDENWKAKISDFGLSKMALVNVPGSVIISRPCGTRGYVDPQYEQHGFLSQSSDVFSFGVVLFEVLCGRLVNVGEHPFSAELARNHYENNSLDRIIDSDLLNQMNSDSLSTSSTIACQCLKKHKERPTMSVVVEQLEKALNYQTGSDGFWHDVYICYRDRDQDQDMGGYLIDDLCAALHQEGLTTNKDAKTQSHTESTLLKAIERSRSSVIIFTKKFAVNSWYLDELAKIIECKREKGQFVLPIFYKVPRSDVQTQKGYFGEVVSEYDTHPRIGIWRDAMVEASNIAAGLEYSNFRFIDDLVKKIVVEIKNTYQKSIIQEDAKP